MGESVRTPPEHVDYRSRAKGFALGGVCLLALLWLALVNGYPVIFYDSGLYLFTAVDRLTAPVARPLVYGWFIFLTSLNVSPWLVVFAQAAIALWVMRKVIQAIDPRCGRRIAAACILGAAALTFVPYFVGQIMADFFSGILPLAIFLLIAGGSALTTRERCFVFLLIAFGVGSHTSHVPIAAASIVALAGTRAYQRRMATGSVPVPRGNAGILLATAALALAGVVVAATNYLTFGRMELTPSAHVFLMGRLLADGPAARHLQRACPEAGYQLCAHLDELPRTHTQYIWTGKLLDETGGWIGSRDESWTIIRQSVAEEPRAVLSNALRGAGRQLVTNGIWQDLPPMPWTHVAVRRLTQLYPEEHPQFARSLQQQGRLQWGAFRGDSRFLRVSFFFLAFAACAIAWRRRARNPDWMQLVVTCVVFYVVNAVVCGVLASVENRYQSRVTWPLAFAGIVLIASVLRGRFAAAPAHVSPPQ